MNYRDFYKNNKKRPISEEVEENLLQGLDLDEPAVDDGLPKRADGSLDTPHDGRPIHLSKIVQIGAEFGKSANGELSGMSDIGVIEKSKGLDKSRDSGGVPVEKDREHIVAGGDAENSEIASKSVGGDVSKNGGQKQGGPNTAGCIAGTPKSGGALSDGDSVLSLQEAKTKLRNMVKEALKEISFNKETGRWERITESSLNEFGGYYCFHCKSPTTLDIKNGKALCSKCGNHIESRPKQKTNENHDPAGFAQMGIPGRPQYKVAGPQYRCAADALARTRQYEPEITEMYDEEEESLMQERYTELATAQRNLSESELSELRDLGGKLEERNWMKNIKHNGACTPMDKPSCTPRRKAFARRAKAGEFSENSVSNEPNHELPNWGAQYSVRDGATQAEAPGKVNRSRQVQKSPRVNENSVNMKMGASHKKVQPRQFKVASDDFSRTNQFNAHVQQEYGAPVIEPDVEPEVEPWQVPDAPPAPAEPHEPEPQTPDPLHPDRPGIEPRPRGEGVMEAGGGAVQHSSYRTANDYPYGKNRHANDIDESFKKKVNEMVNHGEAILNDIVAHCKRQVPTITTNQLKKVVPILFKHSKGSNR